MGINVLLNTIWNVFNNRFAFILILCTLDDFGPGKVLANELKFDRQMC